MILSISLSSVVVNILISNCLLHSTGNFKSRRVCPGRCSIKNHNFKIFPWSKFNKFLESRHFLCTGRIQFLLDCLDPCLHRISCLTSAITFSLYSCAAFGPSIWAIHRFFSPFIFGWLITDLFVRILVPSGRLDLLSAIMFYIHVSATQRPVAAATDVLPTPPLPAKNIVRRQPFWGIRSL